jgi:type III pantothenate kinase
MSRYLTIDVGNTQMVFGLYEDNTLRSHWRLSSGKNLTPDELGWNIFGMFSQFGHDPKKLNGIMAASVVPHLDTVLAEACEQVCDIAPAFIGSSEVKTGMAVDYKNPREVGADRIANAVAAREHFGAPVIVLDCGTATTFDIVAPSGHYAGGLIIPGMEIALEALWKRAAKLPEVSIAPIDTLIGRDTVASMQAGSYWAAVDGLNGIIRRLRALDDYADAPIVATGGLAGRIRDDLIDLTAFEPHLTLEGLRLLAARHFA